MTLLRCRTLQNVKQKCNKLSTPFPAGGFPPDTASSTCSKAQTWLQFNLVMPWTTMDEFSIIPKTQGMSLATFPWPLVLQDGSLTFYLNSRIIPDIDLYRIPDLTRYMIPDRIPDNTGYIWYIPTVNYKTKKYIFFIAFFFLLVYLSSCLVKFQRLQSRISVRTVSWSGISRIASSSKSSGISIARISSWCFEREEVPGSCSKFRTLRSRNTCCLMFVIYCISCFI